MKPLLLLVGLFFSLLQPLASLAQGPRESVEAQRLYQQANAEPTAFTLQASLTQHASGFVSDG